MIISKLLTLFLTRNVYFSLLCIWVRQKLMICMVCEFDTVYRKIPIYRKFRYIGMTEKFIPINRYWFQYRYFRYIGIPNIPIWHVKKLSCSGLEFYRGNCHRGRTKCRGSLRQRRQCNLPYSVIFILFTVHYYFDTWIQMLIKSCINYYFTLSFLRKKH
jgi:hypothetical protein